MRCLVCGTVTSGEEICNACVEYLEPIYDAVEVELLTLEIKEG